MTKVIDLLYGKEKIKLEIPEDLVEIVEAKDLPALANPEEEVEEALDNPIGFEKISDIVQKGNRITIIMPDFIHQCEGNKLALQVVLRKLHSLGINKRDITIIDAIGLHNANTKEEMALIYGKEVVEEYKVICHNARDENSVVKVGESKLGDPVYINKLVMDADLCIAISEVASVPTAGYTGGSKMISVGCAGAQAIYHTHSLSIYYHPTSRCGKYIGNVFREHLDAILQKAESESKSGKFFLVNIIPNSRDMMVGVCAGDFIKSYFKACTIADQQWKVPIPREADIFIAAAGYPHDRSPYHISTSLSMLVLFPKPVFREGGVVIFPAPCDEAPKEGTTEYEFIKVMRDSFSIEDIYEKMRECEEKRIPTPVGLMRAYGTSLVVDRASEIFVVDPKIPGLIRDMWHTPVRGINEALRRAFNVVGSSASVVIAPSGIKIGGIVVCVS